MRVDVPRSLGAPKQIPMAEGFIGETLRVNFLEDEAWLAAVDSWDQQRRRLRISWIFSGDLVGKRLESRDMITIVKVTWNFVI
jgi:hypothetical protein